MTLEAEAKQTYLCKIGKNEAQIEFDSENGVLAWIPNLTKRAVSISLPLSDVLGTETSAATWSVHYVERGKDKWRLKTVTFSGHAETAAQQWAQNIQQAARAAGQNRPRRLLVFINPDGGKKTGVKDYKQLAAPLFEKAGVTADVIVTEDGDHATRVLCDYNLASVDGVIAVGGDGTYMRVVNGLIRRRMKEAGRDVDDKNGEITGPKLRVGIIPGGTGQAMITTMLGMNTRDITTAVLQIVLGYTSQANMLSVYNNNKLVYYSVLHVGYGFFGDMIESAESKRSLGRLRYAVTFAQYMFKHRPFDATVRYLPFESDESIAAADWPSIAGTYSLINSNLYYRPDPEKGVPRTGVFYVMDASRGRAGNFSLMKQFMTDPNNIDKTAGVTRIEGKIMEYDLPAIAEGSDFKHILNIDGDAFTVSPGEIRIRQHIGLLSVFGQGCQTASPQLELKDTP